MVAGVIVSAVGDELVIAHPTDVLPGAEVAAVVAGPAIYLLAHGAVPAADGGQPEPQAARRRARLPRRRRRRHVRARRSCSPRCVLAILVAVIAAEVVAGARRRARGEPSPLEALERT